MAYSKHEFALLQNIGVLKSLGLEFQELSLSKGSLSFSKPYLDANFLQRYTIINEPFLKIEHFELVMSEGFRMRRPDKEALIQSALIHYDNTIPKFFDQIVEYTYQNALRHILQKEKAFTASFLLSINENLKHLSEALLDFQAKEAMA